MQTGPNLTLQIKPTDYVPILEIEMQTERKAPKVSLSNISEITLLSEDIQHVFDEQFINQLKSHGLYDRFPLKQPSNVTDVHITVLFSLSSIPQVVLIQTNDCEDILNKLRNSTQPLHLVHEQQNDEISRDVI